MAGSAHRSGAESRAFAQAAAAERIASQGAAQPRETPRVVTATPGGGSRARGVLLIVENLPVPFDRRVWQEATALRRAGYTVSVICPQGKGHDARYEELDGIHIYRHPLPAEGNGPVGYALEYAAALGWELWLSWRVWRRHGFDAIHACNPPDLIFLVALLYKLLAGTTFIFDHHDINPELYEAKFGRRGVFHRLLCWLERLTFASADVSLATNDTFRDIAIRRGKMDPGRVWVVKSYPDLDRFRRVDPAPGLRDGFEHLIGYVGIMAQQDGVDLLLDAMAYIVHERGRRDVGCLLIGEGPAVDALRAQARALDLEAHVRFCGYLQGEALLAHLSAVDVGAIPDPHNTYNDKISMNKVFEYMALGIPFAQFELRESCLAAGRAARQADGHDGLALGRALLALVDDPAARDAMSQYGRERAAEAFRWETEKAKLLDAYRCAIGCPETHRADVEATG